jgi:Flp pilus assembly protein TadG
LLNIKHIACRLRSAEGAEIAEAALVLPLVFMLLLGIVWFGRAFNIYSTIQQAAQQGAIIAARSTCATCTDTFPLDNTVATAVKTVMQASNIDPTEIPPNSNPPTAISCVNPPTPVTCTQPGNITICRQVLLNYANGSTTLPAQCGVVVSFQYPFQFYLPYTSLNLRKVILSAQAQSRTEN